jgi:hypothetical protein
MAATASAGNLAVTGAAAHTGSYGLEVGVTDCVGAQDLSLLGSISSDETACETISTTGTTTVSGVVTFTAGTSIVLDNGFSVANGSTFTAALDFSLTPFAWVQDDSPANETTYTAEFFLNPDSLTVTGSGELEHFTAYYGGTKQFQVVINSSGQVVLEVRDDAGVVHESTPVNLTTGWNKVVVSWEAAASATTRIQVKDSTGTTVLGEATILGIDTDAGRITSVRWGAVGGIVDYTAATGSIRLDDFASYR